MLPRKDIWSNGVFAATYTLNGDGEMTGTHWIRDLETLNYPIMLTNTGSVGGVMDAVAQYTTAKHPEHKWDFLPVVAETFDGTLNDIQGRHVHYPEVAAAFDSAHNGPVEEGNVGGGTGMICFRFKCGTGTSSRRLPANEGGYQVGVLVQANFGTREQLTIDGVPVGRELVDQFPVASDRAPLANDGKEGSIIVVVATDAPVSSVQLQRMARRASLGLARTGSTSGNSSGGPFHRVLNGKRDSAPRFRKGTEYPVSYHGPRRAALSRNCGGDGGGDSRRAHHGKDHGRNRWARGLRDSV